MTPRRLAIPFLFASLVALLALAAAAPAGAKPAKAAPPAKVAVGHPTIGITANGLASILVPVHYPIELKGRLAELRVALIGARGKRIRSWVLHERLNGGKARLPDRRRSFTFVHRVGLRADLSRRLRQGAMVRVVGSGEVDVDEDGRPEMSSHDVSLGKPVMGPRAKPVCSSVPHLRVKRGGRVSVPLPVCDRPMDWTAARWASHGNVLVRGGRFVYNARKGFQGTDQIQLESKGVTQYAQVTVGAASGAVVRALGDSVTAGFGYYSTGTEIGFGNLLECRPAEKNFNDACSSNSVGTVSKEGPVEYAPDYGLSKNISWAAQWANGYGITNYKNFAISGSEPGNWAPPEGTFYEKTVQVERENPDYILLTLGANPLLSRLLTSPKDLWCAATSTLKEFEECIEEEFVKVGLRQNLRNVYKELLSRTRAMIYVMQYPTSIPWSALDSTTKIALAESLLDREITSAVAEFASSRLRLVTPPHFNVGIDIEPVFPSLYSCSPYPVDGRSVQSIGTQLELKVSHYLSFCEGPNWVINHDTGIHPSAAGYKQMAVRIPPPSSN
ncbi:MAG TPA: SGNH/GDSL hydrolase family protein [Solirubrobacterales bacterium]|nr:SGNH/GDSL hydrolase family protein [Solirubrobacterales bacterium]